jgi:glutamine synthetase
MNDDRNVNDPFALTNPISLLLKKPREEYTREDLIRIIKEEHLERITFRYTALDGKLKELKIPITSRLQAERVLAEGERVDGSSLFKGMMDAAVSDLYVVPVYRTAFLNPFERGSLDLICRYVTRDGEVAPFTLDSIVYKASRLFQKRTGLDLYAFGELEFFLLSEPESTRFPVPKQGGYHASAPFVKSGEVVDEMTREIARITGAVKYAHSEVGYVRRVRSDVDEIKGKCAEQMEIEFLPMPIDVMADVLVLARYIIRNVAQRHDCVATFAPKIEEGIAGNGFHVHMELRRDGHNVMSDAKGKLTREARMLIGGLCHYADSLTAFGNTVSSAYLRLVPNQEAPTRICWSDSNRSAMIRVPLAWGNVDNLAARINRQQKSAFVDTERRKTVELRSPDGSAITHLLLAGIAMAAEWGLTHDASLELAEKLYVTGNVFKDPGLLERLPVLSQSCVESARVLVAKRSYFERDGIFPPSAIDYVAKLLRGEADDAMNEHLADLPADDRLLETRRIMHRDLHRH